MKLLLVILIFSFITACSSSITDDNESYLKGIYSYMADAAFFTDCKTNKKYPVSFEADNIALEKAYLKIQNDAGGDIVVTLFGHYENRPKMEGVGTREFLVVEKFDRIWPHIDCDRNLGSAKLENTFWSLRQVINLSFRDFKFKKSPNIIISKSNYVKGFSGCNDIFGKSVINKDTLKFNSLTITHKMCDDFSDDDSKLLDVLKKTSNYKIYGEFLYLYNKEVLLAIFESVYF